MANKYKVIDEKTWNRAMHCMIFRNSVEPAFCVTFEADITRFKRVVKEQGVSFTLAMVYAVCKCANDIDAFRYRFVDGQIVLFDKIDTAFTYLNQETELFKVVNVPMIDDLKEYCEFAETIAKEQKEYIFFHSDTLSNWNLTSIEKPLKLIYKFPNMYAVNKGMMCLY